MWLFRCEFSCTIYEVLLPCKCPHPKLPVSAKAPSGHYGAQCVIIVLLNESHICLHLANKEENASGERGKQTHVALVSMHIYIFLSFT